MIEPKARILLVDDETRFIDSLQLILNHANYECHTAYSGTEAIELLKTNSFNLALLDINLPDISGCDLVKHISTRHTHTTIIMLTGIHTVESAVQAMQYGAYDYLSKPIGHDQLLNTLEKALHHNQLKRELQTSEQRFQILSEAAWECIIIHNDGMIMEANKQLQTMLGYGPEDIACGLSLEQIITPASLEEAKRRILQKENSATTAYAQRKDGVEIPIEIKSRSINYLNEDRRVCVIRDISERLKAEEEKLALQDKLASASKLNALGFMAGSIAHDLNNILTGIINYPDLMLLQMDENDKFYRQIKKIQETGKRAAAVVSDLVAITRDTEQPKVAASINEIITRYLNSLEHGERMVAYPNVNIKTDLAEDIRNTCCSPPHIHKLLLNLIGNSLEAFEDGGTITITTVNCLYTHPFEFVDKKATLSAYLKLVIADDGPGISSADAQRIFEPFYSTKVMGRSGSGLGLSIVWNIIQEHKGWIELKDSTPGATFEIYLPATEEQACPVVTKYSAVPATGAGERILIIDDQAEQNEILEASLTNLGYRTHSVTSGEKGLEFLQSQPVDLILLDMIMGGGLNGRETLEKIRKNNPGQKTIVISGYAKRDEIERTKALGISCFLEKPFTISKLSYSIRNSLTDN